MINFEILAAENIIHTRRDSEFFGRLSNAFNTAQVELNSVIEVRQFTAACELVCKGAGVAIVSELDATKYVSQGLDYRPFRPMLPHTLSLVRPVTRQPSMVVMEFIEYFTDSLKPFLINISARP